MPRRSILSATERDSLLGLPEGQEELIRHYTLNDADLALIRQRRKPANRLGFAIHLCYLRFPGIILGTDQTPAPPMLANSGGATLAFRSRAGKNTANANRPGKSISSSCKRVSDSNCSD